MWAASPLVRRAAELGREEIERVGKRHGSDPESMARELEVSPSGLRRRMKQLGLEVESKDPAAEVFESDPR